MILRLLNTELRSAGRIFRETIVHEKRHNKVFYPIVRGHFVLDAKSSEYFTLITDSSIMLSRLNNIQPFRFNAEKFVNGEDDAIYIYNDMRYRQLLYG